MSNCNWGGGGCLYGCVCVGVGGCLCGLVGGWVWVLVCVIEGLTEFSFYLKTYTNHDRLMWTYIKGLKI